jgi:hypothetical protein
MNKNLLAALTSCTILLAAATAQARTPFDGQWNITFATQRGNCSPSYSYSVTIDNGVISSPGVQGFRGDVTRSGAVRASVAVQDKQASGAGKLVGVRGRGSWAGYSGNERCAGSWSAQRVW